VGLDSKISLRDRSSKVALDRPGLETGPEFKPVLDAAFEAQLDGAFVDEVGGISWLKSHLRNR